MGSTKEGVLENLQIPSSYKKNSGGAYVKKIEQICISLFMIKAPTTQTGAKLNTEE